jgi:hypothetical protein
LFAGGLSLNKKLESLPDVQMGWKISFKIPAAVPGEQKQHPYKALSLGPYLCHSNTVGPTIAVAGQL